MRIFKEVILYVTIILAASCESRPITLNNYAPAHEYKSTDYSFSYGVKDPHTGDMKNQWEEKKDNVVRGEYSLVEADGSTRTVQYTADDKNGFNAVVKYDQHSVHPISESKEATSHNTLNLNPSKEAAVAYSSYTNNLEGSNPLTEVQTIVQHEYKLPESYSEIQSLAIQHYKTLTEKQQAQNQQVQNQEQQQQQQQYIYVPQQESASEESKKSDDNQNAHIQSYYAYESNQNDGQLQDEEQHESQHQEVKKIIENQNQIQSNGEYTVNNIHTQLPLQLSVLPDSADKIPVDVNILNPIKIDLTKLLQEQFKTSDGNQESTTGETVKYSTKDNSVQPSHQFTPEEVQKFIDDYNNKLNQPVYETGFVPITTKPNHLITQPMVPNTYRSNLKVNMTPGLKHYSSRGNSKFKKNKYENFLLGQQKLVPLYYADLRKDGQRPEYTRLHRSIPNRNQFIRIGKHFRFRN